MRYNDSAKTHSSKPLSNAIIGPFNLLLVYIFTKSKDWKKNQGLQQFSRSFRIQVRQNSARRVCIKIQLESLQLIINSQSITIRSLKTHNINNYTVLRQQGVLRIIIIINSDTTFVQYSKLFSFEFNKYISSIKIFVLCK